MHARSKRMMAEFILACSVYLLSLPVVPGMVPGAKIKAVSKTKILALRKQNVTCVRQTTKITE